MKIKKKSYKLFLNLLLLITISSCFSRVEKRGFMFDLSDYELLQEGVTNQEKAKKIMGEPTLISDLDSDEAWIYYSEDIENFLFFKPKITARNILVLKFDHLQNLQKLEKVSFANEEQKLIFTPKHTEVESHKTGFFKSIFSNVGQIKAQ